MIKNLDSCRRGYPFSRVDCGVDPEGFTPFARLADLYHTHTLYTLTSVCIVIPRTKRRSESRHSTCSIFNVKLKCSSAVRRMTRDVYSTDLRLTHCTTLGLKNVPPQCWFLEQRDIDCQSADRRCSLYRHNCERQ